MVCALRCVDVRDPPPEYFLSSGLWKPQKQTRCGTLAGYELREYLLEKYARQCQYCGAKDVPLNLDHVHPRAAGGSNWVSNLMLA